MWLVPRHTSGSARRTDVPASVQSALVRWYKGEGNEADHRASRTLVVKARRADQWIACGCLGSEAKPPLLSPSYLSEAETYYLRRLTSERRGRPEHRSHCPFFREQAPQRIREKASAVPREIAHPQGYFSAHKLAPEKLAMAPDGAEVGDRARGVAIPRLARLMWMLLEKAQTNIVPPLPATGGPRAGLYEEFARVQRATASIEIAPRVSLAKHFYTHVEAIGSLTARSTLKKAEPDWPRGHAPQAFALLYANDISGTDAFLADGYVLSVVNRIQHASPSKARTGGPFLVLVLIAEHSPAVGYVALRAYAQPIVSAPFFVPVNTAADREIAKQLLASRYYFRRRGLLIGFEKPLFDVPTRVGLVRPDFLMRIQDYRTGEIVETALFVGDSAEQLEPKMQQAKDLGASGAAEVLVLNAASATVDMKGYIAERVA